MPGIAETKFVYNRSSPKTHLAPKLGHNLKKAVIIIVNKIITPTIPK